MASLQKVPARQKLLGECSRRGRSNDGWDSSVAAISACCSVMWWWWPPITPAA
jgi:hypothetical protein